jgi:GT2 family glycosyltransferase
VDWLTGACLITRGDVLRSVGGFDPAIFLYSEDLDWCWRVREAGWEIVLDPTIPVLHEGGASSGAPSDWRARIAMAGVAYVVRKHRGAAHFGVFATVKAVLLGLRWLLQGAAGLLTGSERRRRQAREARSVLSYWLFALRHGASTDPGSERFLRAAGFGG